MYLTVYVLNYKSDYITIVRTILYLYLIYRCKYNTLVCLTKSICFTVITKHIEQQLLCLRSIAGFRVIDLYISHKFIAVGKIGNIYNERIVLNAFLCVDIDIIAA